MKSIILLSSVLLAAPAMAHSNNHKLSFSSDTCNVELQQTLRITPLTLEIENTQHQIMLIDEQGNLTLDGQNIAISNSQQKMLTEYASGLRSHMPQVAEIALEGVKIAGVAIDEISQAFGLKHMDGMTNLMDEVSVRINDGFYQNGTFVIDQAQFDAIGDNLGEEFDQKIDKAMEEAVMNSVGSLLISLGSELIGAGGNMDEFENRMEKMAEQIEQKVELQANELEKKADALCGSIEQLAQVEHQLQQSLPELKNYDLFVANHK
ncbi:DUF2884 family protein [Pseudoalteromonas tunicata]|uniref:Putative secreted protein n=1 Tax=Pseudoalteromonas tunicata D2 TaxID=87626 RepID=A4CE37_9GAMM|nr:DUF2884 family protein [Pseudoalteromonas tunicata]ATC96278.1 hypothetical protein PTUN_a4047 [Pseudoalteromonas tunicata]AXT31789.1 DUF2884 family protein [Pseudoalteromonas tunicata]EAR27229.1 putative secreted protein [Pseudoalteromonas tunicata D2]MDP4982827.1 YggN family protein [Pseudoalteromonas tunicata]MDP5212195.1 DUF2884 family protein [Pseudoalteromonas tunicata]